MTDIEGGWWFIPYAKRHIVGPLGVLERLLYVVLEHVVLCQRPQVGDDLVKPLGTIL